MTQQEIKSELRRMSDYQIRNWFFKNYGVTIRSVYGDLSRQELIKELAADNAQ